jgi:hypothetical protein
MIMRNKIQKIMERIENLKGIPLPVETENILENILRYELEGGDEENMSREKSNRSKILREREDSHGDFHKNCIDTCALFYVRTGVKLEPKHIPMLMTCLKQARFFQNPEVEDHVLDGQGYEELYREELNKFLKE